MSEVAAREGATAPFGQSPFALARGQQFESGLLKNSAERLFAALADAKVVPASATGLVDLRLRLHGGPVADLDESIRLTREHLVQSASVDRGNRPTAWLLAGAAISVPGAMMLPEAVLVLDALVIQRDEDPVQLIVGEVKTYPDRAGHTDGQELATARAQSGTYVHGLELVIDALGLTGRLVVSHHGFLVLTKPGSNMPSVRANEDLKFQVERARRGFEQLRDAARSYGSPPPNADLASLAACAPTAYSEACLGFCERVSVCRERAEASGDPALLGSEMAHWLGAISIHRALALIAGATPASSAEADFLARATEGGQEA